jgi:RNA polymerase sigma factor (sigma-70 family)
LSGELGDDYRSELASCAKSLWGRVYSFAMVVTRGDHCLSQDVTQLAFTEAMPEWPRLRGFSEPAREGWLKRVAARKAIDEFRRNDTAEAHRPAVWENWGPREPDTHRDAMAAVALERFWEAVNRLPPQAYRVAVLRWRLDMSQRDIAHAMMITEKTVSSHLSRIRDEVQAALGDYWPIECEARKEDHHDEQP